MLGFSVLMGEGEEEKSDLYCLALPLLYNHRRPNCAPAHAIAY